MQTDQPTDKRLQWLQDEVSTAHNFALYDDYKIQTQQQALEEASLMAAIWDDFLQEIGLGR